MSAVAVLGKSGVNAQTATNPNDFIFHSSYNTLKILETGTIDFTIPANTPFTDYLIPHNQESRPFAMAFMRENALSEAVFQNNRSGNASSDLLLANVRVDYQYIRCRIANEHPTNSAVAHIRYYVFELPL
jgi:hypothetical protein